MPRLSRDIIEHRLPIKPGFRPFKQKQTKACAGGLQQASGVH